MNLTYFIKRVLAYHLDIFIFHFIPFLLFISPIKNSFQEGFFLKALDPNYGFLVFPTLFSFYIFCNFSYYLYFYLRKSSTPGNLFFKFYILNKNNEKLSLKDALSRVLVNFILYSIPIFLLPFFSLVYSLKITILLSLSCLCTLILLPLYLKKTFLHDLILEQRVIFSDPI